RCIRTCSPRSRRCVRMRKNSAARLRSKRSNRSCASRATMRAGSAKRLNVRVRWLKWCSTVRCYGPGATPEDEADNPRGRHLPLGFVLRNHCKPVHEGSAMQIKASVACRGGAPTVTVQTAETARSLAVPAKPAGKGLAVNGGEFLMLALASCYCNDLYR